jgi:hypothetical protein
MNILKGKLHCLKISIALPSPPQIKNISLPSLPNGDVRAYAVLNSRREGNSKNGNVKQGRKIGKSFRL